MEYLLSFLILVLNLVNYEIPLGTALFTAIGSFLFVLLFFAVHKKTRNFPVSCIIMMCYVWQISWVNIFGGPTEELQLPWFYVIGALMVVYAVFNVKKLFEKNYSVKRLLVFSCSVILFNLPLFLSRTSYVNGLKEYVIIGFFIAVSLIAFLFSDSATAENYEHFKRAVIWAVLLTSLALVFQYVMTVYGGITLFKFEAALSFSGEYQTSCYLLMEDHSSATVMIGCGAFYIIERISKKTWFYTVPMFAVVVVSMALTSRRTSSVSLLIALALYVFFHYKGFGKKTVYIFLCTAVGILLIYYLTLTRPVDDLSQLLDDNGRFATYKKAIELLLKNPFGVGYDNEYIARFTGIIPHNTLLRWLCMGGYLFGAQMSLLFGMILFTAGKKKLTPEYWSLIYSVIASLFISDILCARFFVIFCAAAFLMKSERERDVPCAVPEAPQKI